MRYSLMLSDLQLPFSKFKFRNGLTKFYPVGDDIKWELSDFHAIKSWLFITPQLLIYNV